MGLYWNIIRLLSGTAICVPIFSRLESEVSHKSPSLIEVTPIAPIAIARSEPIANTLPTGFSINRTGICWNVVRLLPGMRSNLLLI
jgi:hypothetical protein